MHSRLLRSLLLAALLSPATASAVAIDFTGSAGQTVASTGQVVFAELGTVRFTAAPGNSALTWTSGVGIGIDCEGSIACLGDEVDEIDTFEVATLEFTNGAVFLQDFTVSQLNVEGPLGIIVEAGYVWGGDFSLKFDATDDSVNDGWLTVDVGREIEWIKITAALGVSKDFSLAGLTATRGGPITPTPEPAAMALFLSGLGVLAFSLRRAR